MNLKKVELPAFALYKANAHHSASSWLAYQAAPNEVRLLSFNSDGSIKEVCILDVPIEPILAIRVAYDNQSSKIYVGIAFLTRFMVLEKNKLLAQYSLPLNCNIVDFEKGFAALEGISDGRQVYFVFVTSNGKIVTQPVNNIENRAIIDIEVDSRVTSLCAQEAWGYIGTETGEVLKVDLNTRKIISRYRTKSELPIFSMKIARDILVLGTCDGEIHALNFNLEVLTILIAHNGMIVLLHTDQNTIYSVGDDSILRVWAYNNKAFLEKSSKEYSQRPNLVFTVEGRTYINFYQSVKYEEI